MSDVLLSFGVQNAKADASKMISDLEAAFSNSDPVQIKVGLKVDKSALNTFKSQLSQIVNSISLSNGTPITLRIDGIGDISSQTDNVKKSIDGVSDSAKKASKSLDEMTTSQQRSSLSKLNTLITQIQANSAKWASAENGKGSDAYARYTEQIEALKQLRTEVEAGTVSVNDFADRFGDIKAAAASAATELKGLNLERLAKEQQPLITGTQEWSSAMLKATKLSSEIKEHLASWTAAKNGISKDSYSELSNYDVAMDSLISKLKAGELTNKEFGISFANISTGANSASSAIKVAEENTKSFGDKIKSAVEKFGVVLTAAQAFQLAVKTVKKMVDEVVEIDTAMTELKKVTDETDATYSKFLDNAADRAKSVGATMKDTIEATADFARLGYSIDEASELADVALVYKNVADGISDISEASQSIISTMKAFGIEADNAMSVADKFNAIGNNFAISSAGIGEAMQRSASALAAAGNTIDQSAALITAANTTVQDESQVGAAMKTISLRIRGMTTE